MSSRVAEKQQLVTNAKHSNPFYISVHALCHNKRLKQKRCRIFEQLLNRSNESSKTDYKRRKIPKTISSAVTIDLISDDENNTADTDKIDVSTSYSTSNAQTNAANVKTPSHKMLRLIPLRISRPSVSLIDNNSKISIRTKMTKVPDKLRAGKDDQKVLIANESIVLSDDSNSAHDIQVEDVTTTTSKENYDFAEQNSIQVDEVTVSLIPRPVNNISNTNKSVFLNPISQPFPMLPDETTVKTVIANRTYELPLAKLREGLASCGIPEFAQDPQQTAMQRRKNDINPQNATTPSQPPISLKLSSDLSISLISDDEDDDNGAKKDVLNLNSDPIVNPALLQKLPLNVSIAPATKLLTTPKRKLG